MTNPFRLDKRRQAAVRDAVAVEAAEAAKFTRYGEGRGGVKCSPFGLEAFGRLGRHALAVLEDLALQRAARAAGQPARSLRRWRAELGVALVRALAETAADACRELDEQ